MTVALLYAAMSVFLIGAAVCARVMSLPPALAVSAVKTALPTVYFANYFAGTWTFLDDVAYFEQGLLLLGRDYNPAMLLFDQEALAFLMELSGGHHLLYGWFNAVAQSVFGEHYYAAVFVNVALTFGIAMFLYRLAIANDFSEAYAKGLFVFVCFHWELLAWSSLVNLKDTLVLFMTSAFVYAATQWARTHQVKFVVAVVLLIFMFYWIRFYVPLFLLAAFLLYLPWMASRRTFLAAVFAVFGLVLIYGSTIGWNNVSLLVEKLNLTAAMVTGAARMVLTPLPWSIDPEYSFLFLPAIFHWLFLLPMSVGAILLWQTRPYLRPLFIYLILMLLLYGAFEELQGPRHRVQLLFIYGWAQYHSLWLIFYRRPASKSPWALA